MTAGTSFAGWTPFHLSRHARTPDGSPALRWCWLGARRLEEPFLDQTLEELFRFSPWSLLLRRTTSLDEWAAHPEAAQALTPAGFIFHVSRCGSTLISRSLASLPDARVVSEPRPLADFLALTDDEARRARRLRALVAAHGLTAAPGERRFFIKFDSVSSLDMAFVRSVFPAVPWVFAYRDPVEVFVSNLESGSAALSPGVLDARRLGFEDPAVPLRRYAAMVLARYYAAGLEHANAPGGLLLDYRQLPAAIPTTVAAHFGLTLSAEDTRRMMAVAAHYAKEPGEPIPFEADSAAKQRRASESVRRLVEEYLQPVYQQLESRRHERG